MQRFPLLTWSVFALTVITCLGAIGLTWQSLGQSADLIDALSGITNIINALVVALVGAVITAKLSRNPIGWGMQTVGLALAIQSFVNVYALIAFQTGTEILPGGIAAAWVSEWIWLIPTSVLVMILHLFPTGTYLSPRWRWFAFLSVLLLAGAMMPLAFSMRLSVISDRSELDLANPVGLFAFPDWVYPLMIIPFIVALIGALSSILLRFVRARGVERQQIKWLAYAAAIFIGSLVLTFFQTAPAYQILQNVIALGAPLAIGIAILRYRLFDIDILIRRTLIYGALTVVLAIVYFGSVVLLQESLRALTGQTSDLAIVGSTLVIAALFAPLRSGIQRLIDRRLYRRKYDAALVLANFGTTVRDEVDLNHLKDELLTVVDETMQPAHVSLWLRKVQ